MTQVNMPFGLGNRVAAMANGLSRFPEGIRFPWRVNVHCPLGWREVFPQGIEGVALETAETPIFPTLWDAGTEAEAWDAAGDRAAADTAYARIMAAMAGEAMADAPRLALCGRYHRNPETSASDLAERAVANARDMGVRRVFVFADQHRRQISRRLRSAGIQAVQPSCGELVEDLRRSCGDIRAYMDDWKTLLAAEAIVAADGPASALHPARAAGKAIIYASAAAMEAGD